MSREDVPSPATYRDHLLSQSLFREMFRHNVVCPDGRIRDSPADLNRYRSALQRVYAERTAELYQRRNQLVSEAENILKIRSPRPSEEKRLEEILDELQLELTDGEIPVPKEPLKVPRRYLGSSEPKYSIHERKLLEEFQRKKVLKRDLKILDDWLKEISTPGAKVSQIRRVPSLTWKEFQQKHYARVRKRVSEMDHARHNLIHDFNSFNENIIRKLVAASDSAEEQRLYRSSMQLPVDARVPKVDKSDTATYESASSKTPNHVDKRTSLDSRITETVKSDATFDSVSSTTLEDEDKSRSVDAKVPEAAIPDASSFKSMSSTTAEDEGKGRSVDAKVSEAAIPDASSFKSMSSTTAEDEDKSRSVDAKVPEAVIPDAPSFETMSSTTAEDEDKGSVDARVPKAKKSDAATFESASSTTPKDEDKSSKKRSQSSTSSVQETLEDTLTSLESELRNASSFGELETSESNNQNSQLRTSKKKSQNEP